LQVPALAGGQEVQHREQFCGHFGQIAVRALGVSAIEPAPDTPDAFAGIQRLATDVLQYFGGEPNHGNGALEHAPARLGKGRNRADRLVQLVSDPARHLFQRRNPCDLQQLFEQEAGACVRACGSLRVLHLAACSCRNSPNP
jgi:hypothetical protein